MKNELICAARAVYYSVYEKRALELARIQERRKEQVENPLISVYCPTYNRKDILLRRAIYSVLSQSYTNFEFIIVGDCCTDGTGEMIKNKAADSRIKFVNLEKREKRYPPTRDNHWFAGPVVAANHALDLCKGEWIARIDDDDVWTKSHLIKLLKVAQKFNVEFVSSAYKEKRYEKYSIVHPEEGYVGGHSSWFYKSYLKLFKYNIDCWRKKIDRVNDLDLSKRFMKAGVNMRYVEDVTYYNYPRPGEDTIGSDVYRNSDGIMEMYTFKEH
jgi:glycosyltransferase involved in cell wall biosynthesis